MEQRSKALVTSGFSTVAAAACGIPQPQPQLEQRAPPGQWQLDPLEIPRPAVPWGQHIFCEPSLLYRWPVLSKAACSSQAATQISAKGQQDLAQPCAVSCGVGVCWRVSMAPAVLGVTAEQEPHLQCESIPLLICEFVLGAMQGLHKG